VRGERLVFLIVKQVRSKKQEAIILSRRMSFTKHWQWYNSWHRQCRRHDRWQAGGEDRRA